MAVKSLFVIGSALLLTACTGQADTAVATGPDVPGFWWGVRHGFVFPFAFIGSLSDPDIAIYAVPNRGGWNEFGAMELF